MKELVLALILLIKEIACNVYNGLKAIFTTKH